MQFGKNQLKRCKYGWMLFHGPYIGKCLELYGQYSEAEVSVLSTFIRPGDTAIDVGANIGDLTLPMAQRAGETGRIFAIESHADTFNILCANLALNNITNTQPINAFIADDAKADTSGAWGKYGYVSKNLPPAIITLDSLALETCALIKIDVDGKELEVLKSGKLTISKTRPVIYLENDIREKSGALLEHLLQLNYRLYWHQAPIFDPDNFFGNPINHWAPQNIVSLMMLCIPNEKADSVSVRLQQVTHKEEWWR